MSFTLSLVEGETSGRSNRGKKYILDRKELNHIEISAKGEAKFGVFSAVGKNKFEFVNREGEVDWTINIKSGTWELEHKGKIIGTVTVDSPAKPEYKFQFQGSQPKYGGGTLNVTFNDTDTIFKIDRENANADRIVFAVYRSDDKSPVGQGSGKVEIAQKEKRNFVLVLTSLFCFIRQSTSDKVNKRASMPEVRTLTDKKEVSASPSAKSRARSNSVDGTAGGKPPVNGNNASKEHLQGSKGAVKAVTPVKTDKRRDEDKTPKKTTEKKKDSRSGGDERRKKEKHDSDSPDDDTSSSSQKSSESDEDDSHDRRRKKPSEVRSTKKDTKRDNDRKITRSNDTKKTDHKRRDTDRDRRDTDRDRRDYNKDSNNKDNNKDRRDNDKKRDDRRKDTDKKGTSGTLKKDSRRGGTPKSAKKPSNSTPKKNSEDSETNTSYSDRNSNFDSEDSSDRKSPKKRGTVEQKKINISAPKSDRKREKKPEEKSRLDEKDTPKISAKDSRPKDEHKDVEQKEIKKETPQVVETPSTPSSSPEKQSARGNIHKIAAVLSGSPAPEGSVSVHTTIPPVLNLTPGDEPQPPPYTCSIVSLPGNQYLLKVEGGPKNSVPKITIDVQVDGVSVSGSPFTYN